ncbi:unnamed protein product [Ambrosiozyma monospora]|uniref:Unnamed protein product n=1 Tax=Ambrosiozyma monospora TaxID=43982 RepID=A0A9W7DD27_AMBMO|nr:unnamed protein product [Ambrosiozyma monospora]
MKLNESLSVVISQPQQQPQQLPILRVQPKYPILPNPIQQRQLEIQKNQRQVTSRILSHDITAPQGLQQRSKSRAHSHDTHNQSNGASSPPVPSGSTAKEKRSKACTNCRRSKVKCEKLNDDEACKRCKSQNMNCVYEYKIASYKVVGGGTSTNTSGGGSGSLISSNRSQKSVDGSGSVSGINQRNLQNGPQAQPKQVKSYLSNLLNPVEPPEKSSVARVRSVTLPTNITSSNRTSNTNILSPDTHGTDWKYNVENKLQDFDSKLGSILTLLQQQQQQQHLQSSGSLHERPQITSAPQIIHRQITDGNQSNLSSRPSTSRSSSNESSIPTVTKRTYSDGSYDSFTSSHKRAKNVPNVTPLLTSTTPVSESSQSSSPSNSSNTNPESFTVEDLCLSKILSVEEARELFKFFDSNISSQLFGFNIQHYRVEDIWRNCPLLVATICAIASIHHPVYSHLFVQLEALIHKLSQEILFKAPTNELEGFNTVLALCFCGFWFQKGQMFTGLALQLAKTMNFHSAATNSPNCHRKAQGSTKESNSASGISKKDKLKLWYLLYILDGQQSLVFNRTTLMNSNDAVFKNSRTLLLDSPNSLNRLSISGGGVGGGALNRTHSIASMHHSASGPAPQLTSKEKAKLNPRGANQFNTALNDDTESSDTDTDTDDDDDDEGSSDISIMVGKPAKTNFSDLRLVSQVEYNQAISEVFNGEAWDLLTPASFGLPFKSNLELDKWMVQWTVLLAPFNHNPIWSSKSTLIYYNFAKMHINSKAVREFHMNGAELPTLNEGQIEEVIEEQFR